MRVGCKDVFDSDDSESGYFPAPRSRIDTPRASIACSRLSLPALPPGAAFPSVPSDFPSITRPL